MNDSIPTIPHRICSCSSAFVSTCALSLALVACSAEPEGGADVPAFRGNPDNQSSINAGNGTTNPMGANEQQPAGSATGPEGTANTANNANGGVGGSTSTGTAPNGTAGSSMVATGGTTAVPTPPGEPPVNPQPAGGNCEGTAIFCEDFDGLSLGPLQGVTNGLTPERTVSIIAEPGRGQVLQVQAGPGYASKAGVFLNNFSAPNNSYFGRMFARVAQFPNADSDHWVLVEATGTGSNEQVRPVGGQFQRWAPGSDGPSAGDWTDWEQSNAAIEGGAWECVEWQMDGANGGNNIVLWVDGEEVQPVDRPSFSYPTINRLWFGWVVYQTGEPSAYDVRLDDIVLAAERIGCD